MQALDARFVEEHTSNAEFVAGIKLQAAADSSQGDDDKQRASPAPEAAALGAHASATAAGAQQGQGDQMVANAAEALQKGDADITDAGEVQEPTSINEPPQETSTSTGEPIGLGRSWRSPRNEGRVIATPYAVQRGLVVGS